MILPGAQETEDFGARLAPLLRAGDVIALSGDLGMGKTTLARGLLRGLGHEGDVASPTFPIVQAYDPPDVRIPVWHVDLYRVDDPLDIAELGLDEALEDSALLVEWPERLGTSLWPESLVLTFGRAPEGGRSLTAQVPKAWEQRWPI